MNDKAGEMEIDFDNEVYFQIFCCTSEVVYNYSTYVAVVTVSSLNSVHHQDFRLEPAIFSVCRSPKVQDFCIVLPSLGLLVPQFLTGLLHSYKGISYSQNCHVTTNVLSIFLALYSWLLQLFLFVFLLSTRLQLAGNPVAKSKSTLFCGTKLKFYKPE
jgi:hypothetical protein